jgi:pimeloyl-ACP methyl ester carboxylesterase
MTARHLLDSDCELELDTIPLPLSHELLWTLEWAALQTSPVYLGASVPRGDGRPIIAVPGFLGSYSRLHVLTGWLERIGFGVYGPGFTRNIACPDVLLARLERQIAAVSSETGRPVTLIGHSLGGSLARAAAARGPERIEQVITLGSPLRSVKAHAAVVEIARLLVRLSTSRHVAHAGHVHDATCACELTEALALPFPSAVRRVAIYTRGDGVVDWRTCIDGDPRVDIEVRGTHVGLVVNASAYEAIAQALAPKVEARAVVMAGQGGMS